MAAKLPDELAAPVITSMAANHCAIETLKVERKGDLGTEVGQKRLTSGQLVRIVMPGGSLDGIETRVLAQTTNVLGQPVYRLDYQRQGQLVTLPVECLQVVIEGQSVAPAAQPGVIRATAQQLMQVLGQACPFVGPGLWTVKREEVSTKAWSALLRLVGGGVALE